MDNLFKSSIRDIGAHVTANPASAGKIVSAFRHRARSMNAASHAFISISEEDEEPDVLDDGRCFQSLAGIPYACKDIFETKSLPTTAGSRVLDGNRPTTDAVAVARLAGAGALLVGKANMHEFCYGITGENQLYGTPANPHDPLRIAGGSSSGSALSTAMGTSVFSLGSDTGGSIRVPAALCGLIGMKPTYGLISTKGMIPFCWTLDHAGFITRSVLDAAAVLEVLAGWNRNEPNAEASPLQKRLTAAPSHLKGLKIGIPRRYFFERLDTEITAAVERVLRACQELGATLVEVSTPDMEHVRAASLALQLAEAATIHGPHMRDRAHLYGEDVLSGLVQGQFLLAEHYVQSLRLMERIRLAYAACFRSVDILVTPTTPIIAPFNGAKSIWIDGIEELVGNALTRYTCVFNLTGNPAITLPCARHSLGLPIGVQLIGRPYEDSAVLGVAQVLETTKNIGWIVPHAR